VVHFEASGSYLGVGECKVPMHDGEMGLFEVRIYNDGAAKTGKAQHAALATKISAATQWQKRCGHQGEAHLRGPARMA
jgi:hypothetical protein